jgi:hypothetical protein
MADSTNAISRDTWFRFVQLDPFVGQFDRLRLTDGTLRALEKAIVESPEVGAVIPGTRGVRKMRFAIPGSKVSKRDSCRVYYRLFRDFGTVILWAIYPKSERSDLSKAERNLIASRVARIQGLLDKGLIK